MNNEDVIIFGASSGIGFSTACLLEAKQYKVIAVSRNAERNKELVAATNIKPVNLDVSNIEEIESLFKQHQNIKHIVLSISAELIFSPLKELDIATVKNAYERIWNYLAIIQSGLKFLPALSSVTLVSGSIARKNISGTLGVKLPTVSIHEIVRLLAKEIAPIRINAISPGPTNTALYDKFPNKETIMRDMKENNPLKRIAEPDEIAEAIAFVIHNKNMTGAIIDIDGGDGL
jgi:NAD(P)-dependent dehydrogenase (short-subunit alcohol dehydrogenase family)